MSPEEEADGEALTLLVGAGAGLHGEHAAQLAQHPRLRRRQPLQVLLRSARHPDLCKDEGWLENHGKHKKLS